MRADIPGASRPKIETHQRSHDAKSRFSRQPVGLRIFVGHRRFSRENPTDHIAKRVDRDPNRVQRASQRAVGPALEDGLCRRLVALHGGSSLSVPQTAPGTSWSSTRTHETSRWRLCRNFENVRSVEVGTRDDGSDRIACAPVERNFQTNRTLLTAAALTEIIGNRAQPPTEHNRKLNARRDG